MTRKQKKQLAQELFKYEQIHSSPSSTREEKANAESQILQISNKIAAENSLTLMMEIDTYVQELMLKEQNN